MQTLTEAVWKLNPPGGLFDEAVVVTSFPGETHAACRNLVFIDGGPELKMSVWAQGQEAA